MNLRSLECQNCAASLPPPAADRTVRCEYCQHVHLLDDPQPRAEKRPAAPRPPEAVLAVGDRCQIEWGSTWYDGVVLAHTAAGGYRIHYDGYSETWDENVKPSRVRRPGGAPEAAPAPSAAPAAAVARSRYQRGQVVGVLWKTLWFEGRILQVHPDGRYRITYVGWSSSWDETVGHDRLRDAALGFTGGTAIPLRIAGVILLFGIAALVYRLLF